MLFIQNDFFSCEFFFLSLAGNYRDLHLRQGVINHTKHCIQTVVCIDFQWAQFNMNSKKYEIEKKKRTKNIGLDAFNRSIIIIIN